MFARRRFSIAFALLALSVVLPTTAPSNAATRAVDIRDRIAALPSVQNVAESGTQIPNTRFFRVEFVQPVDHEDPGGPTFVQRVTVLHRSETAPVVLHISGYYLNPNPVQYEPTAILQSNQIHVEHRFFEPSRPDSADWSTLNIAQSAADHHDIIQSFKSIYSAKWVSTGASKGGMASVYNRYFYPDDVDATIAYVAPSSHGTQDPRYREFVASLGSSKCRKKLIAFQRKALKKRAKLVRLMGGGPYDVLGKDRALEFAILEMPFILWQYGDANLCTQVPGSGASTRQIFDFLDRVVSVESYGDPTLTAFEAYFYQSATQLGGPAVGEAGLEDLVAYPGQDGPELLPPVDVPKTFDPAVMPAVEAFVQTQAERILFIYGANDPWSTNAFEVNASNDTYRLFVTGTNGNHGSQILELSDSDEAFVRQKLGAWLNVSLKRWSEADRLLDPRYRIDRPSRQELYLR